MKINDKANLNDINHLKARKMKKNMKINMGENIQSGKHRTRRNAFIKIKFEMFDITFGVGGTCLY